MERRPGPTASPTEPQLCCCNSFLMSPQNNSPPNQKVILAPPSQRSPSSSDPPAPRQAGFQLFLPSARHVVSRGGGAGARGDAPDHPGLGPRDDEGEANRRDGRGAARDLARRRRGADAVPAGGDREVSARRYRQDLTREDEEDNPKSQAGKRRRSLVKFEDDDDNEDLDDGDWDHTQEDEDEDFDEDDAAPKKRRDDMNAAREKWSEPAPAPSDTVPLTLAAWPPRRRRPGAVPEDKLLAALHAQGRRRRHRQGTRGLPQDGQVRG